LQKLANLLGIKTNLVSGIYRSSIHSSGHCWVEYRDLIVDVTATQFYKDIKTPISVSLISDSRYFKQLSNESVIKDIKHWPAEQQYDTYKNDLWLITVSVGKEILARA
jgi:hypothetical protein